MCIILKLRVQNFPVHDKLTVNCSEILYVVVLPRRIIRKQNAFFYFNHVEPPRVSYIS